MKSFASLFMLLVCSSSAGAEWTVVTPERVVPGEAIPVVIYSDLACSELTAEARAADRLVCRNRAADIAAGLSGCRDGIGAQQVFFVLLGIPSTFRESRVEVRVSGREGAWLRERSRWVDVEHRVFSREEIVLNEAMSTLRRSDADLIRTQAERLWEVLLTSNPSASTSASPFELPLDQIRYTAGFGDRRVFRYSDGQTDTSIHHGLDFGGASGTPVFAPATGRVVISEARVITGLTVVIEHMPGVYSSYYHLSRLDVARGDVVFTGSMIGAIGATGLVTGPHLHWEIRIGGVAVDPLGMLPDGSVGRVLDRLTSVRHIIR